jgi:drug/metabolite transporter (DMT)-like permease
VRERPYVVLVAAVFCVSLASVLVKAAEAPALAIAVYRVGLASLFLSPFALPALLRSFPLLPPGLRWGLVSAGIALGLHFATWISSLSFTSIASSVLLVNTAPLLTLALSRAILKETPPSLVVVAMGIALLGVALIAWGDFASGPDPVKGDLLAVAGALALSVYHVAGRALRNSLPLGAYVLGVWLVAAVALAALAIATGVPLRGFSARSVLAILALAVVPTLGGHGLQNRALRFLPAPTVGLFLLGEPVGATALAYLFYSEVPSRTTLLGGALVLAGLALATLGGLRR